MLRVDHRGTPSGQRRPAARDRRPQRQRHLHAADRVAQRTPARRRQPHVHRGDVLAVGAHAHGAGTDEHAVPRGVHAVGPDGARPQPRMVDRAADGDARVVARRRAGRHAGGQPPGRRRVGARGADRPRVVARRARVARRVDLPDAQRVRAGAQAAEHDRRRARRERRPSTAHSSVAPGSAETLNVALRAVVLMAGPSMTGGRAGAVVSTVQVRSTRADALPAASTATTENVWLPSRSPPNVTGDRARGPRRRRPTCSGTSSPLRRARRTSRLPELDRLDGEATRSGAPGAVVSTVTGDDASALLPAASVAVTAIVCAPSGERRAQRDRVGAVGAGDAGRDDHAVDLHRHRGARLGHAGDRRGRGGDHAGSRSGQRDRGVAVDGPGRTTPASHPPARRGSRGPAACARPRPGR